MEDRNKSLLQLFAEMETTKLPLREKSPLVPGEGNPQATVVFIGEAAGYHEAQQQRPFVGQAGKLLEKLFIANNMRRDEVWITNVVKARPPQNRDPQPEEIEQYRPFLDRELGIIKPKIIASLGRFAMNWFLESEVISRAHGQVRKLPEERLLFPLYHPAAALRNGKMMESLRADFAKMVELVRQIESGEYGSPQPEMVTEFVKEESSDLQPTQRSLF